VLATIGDQKALLAGAPNNVEALTTVRRSMHTLKGSGRMVGLKELGEVAWELEQTLNLWLRQDTTVTPDLQRMIDDAHTLFSTWVSHLENGQGGVPDAGALVALAGRLRGVEPAVAVPVVEIEPPVEQAAAEVVPVAPPLEVTEAPEPALPLESVVIEAPVEPEEAIPRSTPKIEEISNIQPVVKVAPTLYDIFREEARGHLQTLVAAYAVLDANPSAPTTFDMTRAAHTLGGIAATVGLMPLNHLAIALEHALLRRDGSAHPESIEGLETVRQSIITLEEMFAGLALQRAPDEQIQLIAALDDIYHPAPAVEEPVSPAGAEIIAMPGLATPAPTPEPVAEPTKITADVAQLNDEFDEQLLPIFLEEAGELTRDLTAQARAWRSDLTADVAPHAIARLLHTFKGAPAWPAP
jgi:chemosensory pili system protein ChpA (sensor histidine kinase/response regulator)